MTTRNTLVCLIVLVPLFGIAGTAPAAAAPACDGAVEVRNAVPGSALILSNNRLENLRYGKQELLDGRQRMTPTGRRVAHDPRLLSPYASTMDAQRGRCAPGTFKANHPPEAQCGGGHDLCCDSTGDLDELLCIADLINLCSTASNCTLIPGSGGQGPVCVCTD